MSKRAVIGDMSLCYVTTSNDNIESVIVNNNDKIVCINDVKVIDEEDEDSNENDDKKQNVYNQLQEVLKTVYCGKSRFKK